MKELEFTTVTGSTAHNDNQLWRFERTLGQPKGVHSIIAVKNNTRLRTYEKEDEEGNVIEGEWDIDFTENFDNTS